MIEKKKKKKKRDERYATNTTLRYAMVSMVTARSTRTRSIQHPSSPGNMQSNENTSNVSRHARSGDSSWKDVIDEGNANDGKVSLASLMPEGFQGILSRSHRLKNKKDARDSTMLSIGINRTVGGQNTGVPSSKKVKLSSVAAHYNDNSTGQNNNSYENTLEQKPSTHRIYLTPEEVPHNKSKLSLQMCWMRPNIGFTDETVDKMIPPPYSFSVGELFQFQTIPPIDVSDRKYTSGTASKGNIKPSLSKTSSDEKQDTQNTPCGNIQEESVKGDAKRGGIGDDLAPYLTSDISFNIVDHSCTMDDSLVHYLKKLTRLQWMELFEVQDNTASSLPTHNSLLQFKIMSAKQRRSFFQCISTSTLADYFMSTPPKAITNDMDFQDFRELINTVMPFSSYFLKKKSKSAVGLEGNLDNVYNNGILRNAIQDFKWYTLGPYGRQIEMDITLQLLGSP